MKLALVAILLTLFAKDISGHGTMVKPLNWFEYKHYMWNNDKTKLVFDFTGMKSQMQCTAGCEIPPGLICNSKFSCEGYQGSPGCSCMWYMNNTLIQKPTLFDENLRTYGKADHQEYYLHTPWRAPGSAPIDSPCGVAGGNLHGCEGGKCDPHKGGYGFGPRMEDVDFLFDVHYTSWKVGSIVEVAWGIVANHGGGYSYRLCKVPHGSKRIDVTEECFQQTPLKFYGDKQWIQYGDEEKTRIEIPAVRTTEGTFPEGSQWTKNPIPACIGGLGGFYYPTKECPHGTQFEPPKPDLYGFGVTSKDFCDKFKFSIVDKVIIPYDLTQGNYVLSFRWDVEQTPQVWNTCASISLYEA